MTSVAVTLAEWAAGLEPDREDLELAHRSLLDTVAVTLAARDHRVTRLAEPACRRGRAGPWPGTCSTSTTCTCRPPRTSAWCACRPRSPLAAGRGPTWPRPG